MSTSTGEPEGTCRVEFDAGEDGVGAIEDACPQTERQELLQMVESEIIPRLLLSHQLGDATGALRSGTENDVHPSAEEVAELTQLVILRPVADARTFVEAVIARGVSVDLVLLGLLTPSARLLGEMWLDDLCTFAEVTVGLSRLHQLVYELSPPQSQGRTIQESHGIVVFCPAPGEQHTFGLLVASEFFRKAGWNVRALIGTDGQEVSDLVKNEWVAMVGFSVSVDAKAEQLRRVIAHLRTVSRNPDLIVIVGGCSAALRLHEDRLGATLCTSDALEAVHYLEAAVATKHNHPILPQESN